MRLEEITSDEFDARPVDQRPLTLLQQLERRRP
jgi:hypothetical protein